MKSLSGLSIAIAALFLLIGSGDAKSALLGRKECTFGPTYWCSGFGQAKHCNAFDHCKQTVWEKTKYPLDNDEICKICLDMVTQARDQLRSNETLEDLKAVFEGSCALIPIKLVRKECDKLVDDFIPELVEALSSEMDPTAVCSVAGLCNNKKIDDLLAKSKLPYGHGNVEYEQHFKSFNCKDCRQLGTYMVEKFKRATPNDVLMTLMEMCRQTGSFSDSCHSLAVKHFEHIFNVLKQRFTADSLCHLSGACHLQYHNHGEANLQLDDDSSEELSGLEVRPMGDVGMLRLNEKQYGDVPCEWCKQMMVHLREMILANTTEAEFKQVALGICGELGPMKDECVNVVDNYSDAIFNALSLSLNPELVCGMIKICPSNKNQGTYMPLLLLEPQEITFKLKRVQKEPVFTKQEIDAFQLPFDTLMGPQNAGQLVENGQLCTMCEMLLHFVQESLAQPATEQQIKESVEGICKRLPKSVQSECESFVMSYGDAVIAMLIQELDPSEICPMMHMCSQRVKADVEIFETKPIMNVEIQSKDTPTCPLCLFAMTEAKKRIESDKSIENIKHTLETLCNHLPQKLHVECTDFVDSYAKTLVNLLVNDLSPQQICVQLKLCTEARDKAVPSFIESAEMDDYMTNEIPDNTYNGRVIVGGELKKQSEATPECLVCQHLVKELEKKLDNNHSREQIKKILDHVCDKVKDNLKDKCVSFMEKHEEQIIDLVMKGTQPKELCIALGFCAFATRRATLELVMEEDSMMPVIEDLDIDEAISIDFIAVPARKHSPLRRLPLTNQWLDRERQPPNVRANEGCILCEFVMTKLEADMGNKKTQDEIRKAVENICTVMPKSVRAPCTKFIDTYTELILTLLATTPPAKICEQLKLCTPPKLEDEIHSAAMKEVSNDVLECAVCQGAVTVIDKLLEDPNFDRDLEKVVKSTCTIAPKLYKRKCSELVESYGPSIINMLLVKMNPQKVCEEISLCFANEVSSFVQINDEVIPSRIRRETHLVGASHCTYGPSYWCASPAKAAECNAESFCLEKHWNGVKPSSRRRRDTPLPGASQCTWGPSHWCSTAANAEKCDAESYCLEKHWNGVKPSA